ncbi:NrfD/PsrC family molybdoenzyme membrane anchor subunit [Sulfolobaceae archaeon RB850M]
MGLFTAPIPNPFGVKAPIQQINEYPLWSEYVALALYFTEVAGMLMAILGILEYTGNYPSLSKKGAPVVFVSTVLAFVFFAMDLGRPFAATSSPLEALANFYHSWMARGIVFVSGLLLFSFLYMLTFLFERFVKNRIWVRVLFATLGMLFGIFSTVYSGFEFAATTGIPFWNNAGLPVLFLAGGVFVGAGLGYILAFFTKGDEGIKARRLMAKLLAFAGIAELASWFLFLASVNYINVFDETAYDYLLSQSTFYADLIMSSLSVIISGGGYLASGPYLAFLINPSKKAAIGEIKPTDLPKAIKYAILIAAVFAIVAAYFTRADILFAGQYAYQTAPMTPFQSVSNQPIPIGSFGWRG